MCIGRLKIPNKLDKYQRMQFLDCTIFSFPPAANASVYCSKYLPRIGIVRFGVGLFVCLFFGLEDFFSFCILGILKGCSVLHFPNGK